MDLIIQSPWLPFFLEFLGYIKKNMNWGGDSKNGWKLRTFLSSHIIAQNKEMVSKFLKKIKNL